MTAVRISEFDLWRAGYGGSTVTIYIAGTTTKANVFTDETLTTAAPNPQTLQSNTDADGVTYGKFSVPLYTSSSYYLNIDTTEESGVVRPPLSSLVGADASDATVRPNGTSADIPLDELMARKVWAENYGDLDGSAATNTTTIELAIAALANGGEVLLPAGTISVNSFNVPQGVVLRGYGKGSTILSSVIGNKSFTITGERAGFRGITLDGSSLTSGSIGVYAVNKDVIVLEDVEIKRFETNMYLKGGRKSRWRNLDITNAVTGIKIHGDTDAGDTGAGAEFADLMWEGGLVKECSTAGVAISYEDARVHNMVFNSVGYENNTGTAITINGGQYITYNDCWWDGNTKDFDIQDDTDPLTAATSADNDCININVIGGRMEDGEVEVTGTAQNVSFNNMRLDDMTLTMTTPLANQVFLRDCVENNVTISGESTKLLRSNTTMRGEAVGLTTDATWTKAWGMELAAGQYTKINANIVGKQRNGEGHAMYQVNGYAYRQGDELDYDAQTANFTLGDILTGASSGATARINADSDSGTTGTLTLTDIVGDFVDNETITGSSTGSATVNGTLTAQAVVVGGGHIGTNTESSAGYDARIIANNQEVEVQVLGLSSNTMEWTVNVDVVST